MSKNLTVSNVAEMTGGIAPGHLVETDIDEALFRFNSDDTPLMNLMLRAKRVKVDSPEVDHYMIDDVSSTVVTTAEVAATTAAQIPLPLAAKDQNLVTAYTTLLVNGVNGFVGREATAGKWLMLFCTGQYDTQGNPIVRAINGPKDETSGEDICGFPTIPAGTRISILANSLYETQKEVDPDLIVPMPQRVFLQKRGMNQVVSDYFESQRKRIPFSKAILAEQAIANFKVRGNRTLWAGRAGKFKINVPRMGNQYVYTTEGLRWQFKREVCLSGAWTVEMIIGLAKMFFTGEGVPTTALLLAGKNLLEKIQCIDYSKHPEIQITTKVNTLGWTVTNFHTVFGDIEIKREPTLDRLGWSNSGALIGEDRLVHYVYSAEHSFSDRVEGEEATRNGILIWDAVALKGSCHIWIDGEGNAEPGAEGLLMWDGTEAPVFKDPGETHTYYLLKDCPGIAKDAKTGQSWQGKSKYDNNRKIVVDWTRV